MNAAGIVLLISYPVLVHAYSITFSSLFLWLAVMAFVLVNACIFFRYKQPIARLLLVTFTSALLLAGVNDLGHLVLKLNPVLINAALAWFFFYTTTGTHTPIITRFARLIGDDLDPETRRYTRMVTIAWAICFAGLAIESAMLAAWAPLQTWSLITGFVNYIFVGMLFPLEYALRRYCLPHQKRTGFCSFIRSLVRADYRLLLTD